ncbi:NAD(P)-dependent alcohol dehydrogenase [Pararhodonellum marinum]|uniref:NAD(P)-dependent alcohol dehydrogenase n=1 Tax=Pararhodonellum marinum TaxID=2755358 RepID=UPI00188F5286|nr:NAD(P)-dependent alcohol dehydrogenase [Pararhodonellum marinum]
MKAMVYSQYGGPEVLSFKEVPKPLPKPREVLVKVHASSINDWDWGLLRGEPFVNRLLFGLMKPKLKVLGCDIAGRVEAIGSEVKDFQVGQAVFGDISSGNWGGFAEFVCVEEKLLAPKPDEISFEQAAAIPQAGLLALQGFQLHEDQRNPSGFQSILINGAGGGVGTLAVQLAKMKDIHVTCVDKESKLDALKGLGADEVLDYQQVHFSDLGQRYDLILDVMCNRPIGHYRRCLKPNGTYATVGGEMPSLFKIMAYGALFSKVWPNPNKQKINAVMLQSKRSDLNYLSELIVEKKLSPIIDSIYPLTALREAFAHYGTGVHVGKILIKVYEGA